MVPPFRQNAVPRPLPFHLDWQKRTLAVSSLRTNAYCTKHKAHTSQTHHKEGVKNHRRHSKLLPGRRRLSLHIRGPHDQERELCGKQGATGNAAHRQKMQAAVAMSRHRNQPGRAYCICTLYNASIARAFTALCHSRNRCRNISIDGDRAGKREAQTGETASKLARTNTLQGDMNILLCRL